MRSLAIAIVLLLAVKSCGGQVGHVVSLYWTASTTPNVVYNVYRSPHGAGSFVLLNPSSFIGTTFNDTSVVAFGSYDYEVRAENGSGVQSPPSNIFSVVVP